MNVGTFLLVLASFTGATVTVIGAIVVAIGHVRRQAALAPGRLSAEELEEIRARLAELEQRDLRIEEIVERLDFMERVVGQSREAKPLPKPTEERGHGGAA
jgi:hypothetical protein